MIGAIFIVPNLYSDFYRVHEFAVVPPHFYGPTAPTIGLAAVAVLTIAALIGLLLRPAIGAAISIVAGVALVLFELAEASAIGNVLTPSAGVNGFTSVGLWLQPFCIAVGISMVVLAGRSLPGNQLNGSFCRLTHSAAKPTAIFLTGITVAIAVLYGWAAANAPTSMFARGLAWGNSSTYDYTWYQSRPLPPASTPYFFAQAPLQVDLARATGSSSPDQFLASNATTAILVIQHNKLVLERYYNGADRSTMLTVHSYTKSWTSAMVGIAIAAGYIHSIDDPVTVYVPELARKDPRFALVTIGDLLSMRSGLDWNDNDASLVTNDPALTQLVLSHVRFMAPPGALFFYNDYNYLLLGIVLERATGRTVTQWLNQNLWIPLGAQNPGELLMGSAADGLEKTQNGLTASPIDLIRLGQLYLRGGNWNGVQLVPAQWVTDTTVTTDIATRIPAWTYGMGWWKTTVDGVRVFFGWGDHGEYVLVAPSLDIVVARFGRQFGLGSVRWAPSFDTMTTWTRILTRTAETVATTTS